MYANLAVSIGRLPLAQGVSGHEIWDEEVAAYAVTVRDGVATIGLDANEGESSYYVEAGERIVDLSTHAIAIGADF